MSANRPDFLDSAGCAIVGGSDEGRVKRMADRRSGGLLRWVEARPLAVFALCFAVGAAVAHAALPGLWTVWAVAAVAVAALMLIFRQRALAFSLALLLGALWLDLFMIKPDVGAAEDVLLSGCVDSVVSQGEKSWRVRLNRVTLDGERCPSKVMLYFYSEPPELEYGARLSVRVNTWLPGENADSGGFDYAAWLWRQRVALGASAKSKSAIDVEPPSSFSLIGWSLKSRARLNAVIGRVFPEDSAPFAAALITGDKSAMPEEDRENYRRAGVSHLLALSGLHVGALFLCLEFLLRKMRVNRRVAFGVSLGMMAVYTAVVGCPASIVRAAVMYALARIGTFLGRPRDGLTTLSAALLLLLLVNPLYIEDVGFLLSFTAVGGLILLAPGWLDAPRGSGTDKPARAPSKLKRALRSVAQGLIASMAAQLGTLPVVACAFNQLPVWFLPFNAVLIPAMTLIYPALLAATLLGCVWMAGGAALGSLLAWPVRLFNKVTALGALLPMAQVNCPDWPVWLIVLYALAAVLAAAPVTRFYRLRRSLGAAAMAALAAIAWLLPAIPAGEDVVITFLDVGQGDAAVIQTDNLCYLADVGDGNTAARWLLDEGLTPQGVFLTHGHADHAGGLSAIVEAFPPSTLYVSCLWDEEAHDGAVDEGWQRAIEAGWSVRYLAAGDEIQLSQSAVARIWNPSGGAAADINENCMVLSIETGRSAALITGDLPMSCERIPLPDCTVLKVAHHGAASSTGEIMLAQTTPSVAVVSVGRNNYGHPSPDTLARLSESAVYRTDECGAVTVVMKPDGGTEVRTAR